MILVPLALTLALAPPARPASKPAPPAAATAARPAATSAQVDALVREHMEKRKVPGLSLAVVRDGKVLLARGYGKANVELDVPATEKTVYELGSITKTFTATATMLLVGEGKLSLDDSITKLLPDLPAEWSGVNVRHLLNHTSGIKSYTGLQEWRPLFRKDMTPAEIVKLSVAYPLEFQPGEKWAYNNTGYTLLGMIIEKASGKTYAEFLRERILAPLGMSSTRPYDHTEIIPNRADGYGHRGGKLVNADYLSPTHPYSAGVLASTVLDLAKWDAALYTERILKRPVLDEMWKATSLKDGKSADYGYGWGVGSIKGHRLVQHGGGIPGFTTSFDRFVDDRLTVIVLCNQESGRPGELGREVAGLYIPEVKPEPERSVTDPDPALTERLRKVVLSVAAGDLDPELFTPELRKLIFPDRVKEGREVLSSMGALKTFTLLEASDENGLRRRTYRARFGDSDVRFAFAVNKEGKIAGMNVMPD